MLLENSVGETNCMMVNMSAYACKEGGSAKYDDIGNCHIA